MFFFTDPYTEQARLWPPAGRHILAHFDDESILVYQAYCPAIGQHAVAHGQFGGAFKYTRMSWIKPNFLWMMYRSGWGTRPNQEVTLGLRLRRAFFDSLLRQAVPSSWDRSCFATEAEWAQAVAASDVRLQWDPDHQPTGAPLERRAIQLGLRGATLEAFGRRELLEVLDLTDFVAEQRGRLAADGIAGLRTPRERVYVPAESGIGARLGLAQQGGTECH